MSLAYKDLLGVNEVRIACGQDILTTDCCWEPSYTTWWRFGTGLTGLDINLLLQLCVQHRKLPNQPCS